MKCLNLIRYKIFFDQKFPRILFYISGALLSFIVQYLHVNWVKRGESVLFISSLVAGLLLLLASQITSIILAYIIYVVIASIYHLLITAARLLPLFIWCLCL